MMLSSTFLKAAGAIAVAVAIAFAGFLFIETTRWLVLLICGVLFATFAYFVAIFRGRARDAALVCASLALGLFVIEIVVWRMNDSPTTSREKGSWALNGELGLVPARPGVIHEKKVAANGVVIYDVANTIDENLTRKVVSADSGPTIAFFGDSFTFGAGVNDADTLPQSFADATDRRFRVLNLGMGGYGPQQFLRALEIDVHDALLKKDPRLFVMLTAPWHAFRSACVEGNAWFGPSYALQDGAPVYRGPCSAQAPALVGALTTIFRWTEVYKYFSASRQRPLEPADMDLYIAILTRAGEIARQKYGVPTLILFLPDDLSNPRHYHLGPDYGNDDIMRKLRDGGLRVVGVSVDANAHPIEDLFIPGDGHPTGLSNRIWAKRLRDVVAADFGETGGRPSPLGSK